MAAGWESGWQRSKPLTPRSGEVGAGWGPASAELGGLGGAQKRHGVAGGLGVRETRRSDRAPAVPSRALSHISCREDPGTVLQGPMQAVWLVMT